MPKLVFLGEKFGARVYEFVPEKTTVGRADNNTLVIRDDSVSSAHCEILVNGPEVIVHDFGSANGTFVNGVQVNGQCQVKHGQVLRFGSVEARLDLDHHQWEDPTTEETAVYAMQRIMRDQRRERKNPPPSDPSMTLESAPGAELGDHTVIMTRPAPKPAATPVPASKPEPASSKRSPVPVLITLVAVVAMAALVWWLVSGRK